MLKISPYTIWRSPGKQVKFKMIRSRRKFENWRLNCPLTRTKFWTNGSNMENFYQYSAGAKPALDCSSKTYLSLDLSTVCRATKLWGRFVSRALIGSSDSKMAVKDQKQKQVKMNYKSFFFLLPVLFSTSFSLSWCCIHPCFSPSLHYYINIIFYFFQGFSAVALPKMLYTDVRMVGTVKWTCIWEESVKSVVSRSARQLGCLQNVS